MTFTSDLENARCFMNNLFRLVSRIYVVLVPLRIERAYLACGVDYKLYLVK